MSKWFVGLTKSGRAPKVKPLEVYSFKHGQELLIAMLSEASECAVEAGENSEASALEAAIEDVLEIKEPRAVALSIGQHTYWLSSVENAVIQPLSDARPAH